MNSDKLIIDLNFQSRFIDEQRKVPFDSEKMFELLSETVVDKRTLQMVEIHDLYRACNHTRTQVGAAHLFHSLNTPSESLELIQAKQDSLRELEANDALRRALEDYIDQFASGEEELFRFLNVSYHPMFPYATMRGAVRTADSMLRGVDSIPQPQTDYLDSLFEIIRNYGISETSRLVRNPTFRTLAGIRTRREKGLLEPAWRFRPGRLSFGSIAPGVPFLLSLTAWGTGAMRPALAETLALVTSGGLLIGLVYGAAVKPHIDHDTAVLPIRQRLVESYHFGSMVEAVAAIDELLSFRAFRKSIPHPTVIPEVTDGERHYFQATALRNPVIAKDNRDYVANDVSLGEDGISFITGPNSGGKTTYCKTIVQSQILGQIGAPVLAESARMNIADRIFYQAPAFDSLNDVEGRFGTELRTTRDIFRAVSPKSLAILDEIAEGTTAHEKMNLSVAILTGFYAKCNTTLLVTHAYELVEKFKEMGIGQCLQVEFKDDAPTHRFIPGISRESHAMRVAVKIGFSPADIKRHLQEEGYI